MKRENVNFSFHVTSHLVVLEADAEPHFCLIEDDNRIRYRFVKDCDPIFHRTRYLNDLILAARNPIVGVWDTDVIIQSKSGLCSFCGPILLN